MVSYSMHLFFALILLLSMILRLTPVIMYISNTFLLATKLYVVSGKSIVGRPQFVSVVTYCKTFRLSFSLG